MHPERLADHNNLRRQNHLAPGGGQGVQRQLDLLPGHAGRQPEKRCREIARTGQPHPEKKQGAGHHYPLVADPMEACCHEDETFEPIGIDDSTSSVFWNLPQLILEKNPIAGCPERGCQGRGLIRGRRAGKPAGHYFLGASAVLSGTALAKPALIKGSRYRP